VLATLDAELAQRDFIVGDGYSIADIALYGYVHVADEAGYDMSAYPAIDAWMERVRAQPGYVEDLAPYPPNARPGGGRSLYD
jgi:glutathione S-transferase